VVTFTNSLDPTLVKYARVIATDNTLMTLTVKFGGAPSGIYIPNLQHATYGRLDSGNYVLTTEGYVTSISPTTSSVYGGVLITI
jgi:hypothetical protein